MYYLYKATYYDAYKDEEKTERGFVFAEDYAHAASFVNGDYGSNLIGMYLEEIDCGHTITESEINSAMK